MVSSIPHKKFPESPVLSFAHKPLPVYEEQSVALLTADKGGKAASNAPLVALYQVFFLSGKLSAFR